MDPEAFGWRHAVCSELLGLIAADVSAAGRLGAVDLASGAGAENAAV